MPVYPQTYRHYDGVYRPRSLAWSVIACTGIRRMWKSKGTFAILSLAAIILAVFAGRLYLAANMALVEWIGMRQDTIQQILRIEERFFLDYLTAQIFACFLLTVFIGGDLISVDRRTKAIALYLSKPINIFDYLCGKSGILLAYLLGVLWVGGWLLILLNAVFTEDLSYVYGNVSLAMRVAAFSLMIALPMTMLILCLSSIARSKMASIALFCMVYWLPGLLIDLFLNLTWRFRQPTESTQWESLFSLPMIWEQLGAALFRQEPVYNLHLGWHLVALAIYLTICGVIMARQIRAVEVVR